MDDEELRTLWCGNLSEKVTEEILYELFLQAAPLETVRIPTDKTGRKANYGFVVVKHAISVDYVVQLLDGTCLYDRTITIKPRNCNARKQQNVNMNDLLTIQAPFNHGSPPFHSNFHKERQYGKPYYMHDNRGGRQNWNNHHRNNHNERNRRRNY